MGREKCERHRGDMGLEAGREVSDPFPEEIDLLAYA